MNSLENIINLSHVPEDLFHLKGEDFYCFIQSLAGDLVRDIVEIQMIDSAQNFLNTNNIFDIFQYDSEEIDNLKYQACFKLKIGNFII